MRQYKNSLALSCIHPGYRERISRTISVILITFKIYLSDSNKMKTVLITYTSYTLYRKLLHLRAYYERNVKFDIYYNIGRA